MANVQLLGCWFVALFAACAVPEGELPSLSTSEQKLVDFGPNILSLQPVGYWRLNETSGTTMQDSSPTGIDGTYSAGPSQSLLLNQPGGVYWDTSSRAVMFKGTAGSAYGQIPDHRVLSLARAWDNFSRTYPSFPYTWDTNWGQHRTAKVGSQRFPPGTTIEATETLRLSTPKAIRERFNRV
jgi:hypothetical protein